MSEVGHQGTEILLPGSSVAIFSEDQETLSAAGAMGQDWRFARVNMYIQKGDVDTAISHFQQGHGADLIIIQTNDINDGFTERLGELSSYCSEGTSAIIIGPVNDVYLYRRLIGMGVSDYLVRPIKTEILSHIIAKTLVTKLGVSGSRLVAFIGSKGGVGTSTLAECYAWGVSGIMGHKTMLLDAAGGSSALSVGMGFDPSATLAQIIRAVESKNEDAFKRMLFKASDKLTVLAGGADAMLASPATPDQYEKLLDHLMVKSPVVMVDLSCADSGLKRAVIARANKIIMATTPTVTSLRFARTMLKEISDLRGGSAEDVALIVNQQGISKAYEVPARDIEEAIEHKVSALIPYLPASFLGNESETSKILKDKEAGGLVRSALLPILKSVLSRNSDDDNNKGDGSKKSPAKRGGFLSKLTSK